MTEQRAEQATVKVAWMKTGQQRSFVLAEGHTDAEACREVWERNGYRLHRDMVRGKVVVDIGANVGAFSTLAAGLGAVDVWAYEPHPESFAALQANVGSAPIRIRNEAVVRTVNGPVWLMRDGGAAGVSGEQTGGGYGAEGGGHEVAAVSWHDVWERATRSLHRIGLVKIDCEGCEVEVVQAMEPEHLETIDRIVMEFHGPAMPHLDHLTVHDVLPPLVLKLAQHGTVFISGRPTHGGYLWWRAWNVPALARNYHL